MGLLPPLNDKYTIYNNGILCERCGLIFPDYADYEHHRCPTIFPETKMSLPKLEEKFIMPKSKTLKLKPKVAQQLGPLVEYCQEYLWSQEEFSRVEFKYDRTYIVVAKLKDEE